ncbi:PREDICTED: seipin-2 [Nelumbo nucifera]|uniref:Seipin-2-like n=2 Tax=Nelumbo nucifera TaxID=4432 RepID=A0A822Z2R8_NELNU|nr:PREDICTED: seipin-2 [Nelumbo nucifera]DAD37735.1 TPA_asm: hypothetical protein HUJ06_008376 [Nelumbo nucifera]
MDETEIVDDYWNYDDFFDASDDFPFYNCNDTAEPFRGADETIITKSSRENPLPKGLRRRSSSFRHNRQGISGEYAKEPDCISPVASEISEVSEAITPRERRKKILSSLKDPEKAREGSSSPRIRSSSVRIGSLNEQNHEDSSITPANNERVDEHDQESSTSTTSTANKEHVDEMATAESRLGDSAESSAGSSSSFLVFLAGLVIKAIGLQISLLIKFIRFPIWLSYFFFVLVTDPFGILRRIRGYLIEKSLRMWGVVWESVSPSIYEWLKGQQSIGKLAMSFCWGFFWSVYVYFILLGLLALALVISGFMMQSLVEEPIQITETLHFDYTKDSPVAFVPISSCAGASCDVNCYEKVRVGNDGGSFVIPHNHRYQLTISLTLPESEYNRKLGVFQVRVDFISENGKVTASSSYPCMLQFKSQPIRLLETFLKSVPLVAGYASESQTLNLKMKGFTDKNEPTSCLRVVLEQRAEYRPGSGIPELYHASLVLESELPLFKRVIWNWKITIFIWTGIVSFMMEFIFILVCCRPIIIPRSKPKPMPTPRDGSTSSTNSPQNMGTPLNGS